MQHNIDNNHVNVFVKTHRKSTSTLLNRKKVMRKMCTNEIQFYDKFIRIYTLQICVKK